jgi:hypothetical protein
MGETIINCESVDRMLLKVAISIQDLKIRQVLPPDMRVTDVHRIPL